MDVPVIVDDVKNLPGFDMTRCTYFVIEMDEPGTGWNLGIANTRIPFLMLGLSGVICQPSDTEDRFLSPFLIDQLLDELEQHPSLMVESADIWVPNRIIALTQHEPRRGDVFRLSDELFALSFRYRYQRISDREFLVVTSDIQSPISYSPDETSAFSKWQEEQIQASQQNYLDQERDGLALEWRDVNNQQHPDNGATP